MTEQIPVEGTVADLERRLSPEEARRLDELAERVHQDFGRGEMHLMYRWTSPAKGNRRHVPLVARPHCWHSDCIVSTSPPPEWPEDCACVPEEGHDHSRLWRASCPAHGKGSSWSWAAEVSGREESR